MFKKFLIFASDSAIISSTMNTSLNKTIHLLERLIATPSISRDEQQAGNVIENYLEEEGCHPQRYLNNIWSVAPGFDEHRPTLLLNAHIDTVKPVNAWTRDPFLPEWEGDKLYGLGSNDDGGGLVSLLHTFLTVRSTHRSYNLIFLASAEEEVSGKNGMEAVLPKLPHIDFAIVGEPTGMQPAIAEKGLMVLDVTAHGKAGHAARNEGVNAIYKAMDDINWFRNFRFKNNSEMLGPVKMTVTIINAGTQHNVVPDKCVFTVDIRSNELYSNREIFDIVCKHVESEVKARSFRLNSSRTPQEHPVVQKSLAMGMHPYGSPTLSDQALMPFPSIKLGPGQSSRSHTADEFICRSEIDKALNTYDILLTNLELPFFKNNPDEKTI